MGTPWLLGGIGETGGGAERLTAGSRYFQAAPKPVWLWKMPPAARQADAVSSAAAECQEEARGGGVREGALLGRRGPACSQPAWRRPAEGRKLRAISAQDCVSGPEKPLELRRCGARRAGGRAWQPGAAAKRPSGDYSPPWPARLAGGSYLLRLLRSEGRGRAGEQASELAASLPQLPLPLPLPLRLPPRSPGPGQPASQPAASQRRTSTTAAAGRRALPSRAVGEGLSSQPANGSRRRRALSWLGTRREERGGGERSAQRGRPASQPGQGSALSRPSQERSPALR